MTTPFCAPEVIGTEKTRRVTMPATQPRNLDGQKALVTGATSGIGRVVAADGGRTAI